MLGGGYGPNVETNCNIPYGVIRYAHCALPKPTLAQVFNKISHMTKYFLIEL